MVLISLFLKLVVFSLRIRHESLAHCKSIRFDSTLPRKVQ